MQLEDLRLLAALGEAGSLAGAARTLRVNHASAWRRLGALEEKLGLRLFERRRDGYVATAAGEDALAVAGRTLAELAELERRLAGRDVRATGTVRLTTTETLLDLVSPALLALRRSHPGIMIELVTDNAFFTLTRRDADVALRPASAAPEGLVARRLAILASAIYARRDAVPVDTMAADWIAPDDSLAHLGLARWIGAHVPPQRIVLRASSLTGLRAAVREGIGLAALPCFMADGDERLVRVLPPQSEMSSSLWLLTHPDLRRTARVRAVLDLLARHFVAHRRVLGGGADLISPGAGAGIARPPRSPDPPPAATGSS